VSDEMDIAAILGDDDSEATPAVVAEPVKKQKKPKAEKLEIEVEADTKVEDTKILDIDVEAQRLDPEDFESSGGKRVIDTIAVHKPPQQAFFRVHPTFWYNTGTVCDVDGFDRNDYLVSPDIKDKVGPDFKAVLLVYYITRTGTVGLWPIRPGKVGRGGKRSAWYSTALSAAERGKTTWVRVVADEGGTGYIRYEATCGMPEPIWPEWDLKTIINMAFKDLYIKDMNHPVIQKLLYGRGE